MKIETCCIHGTKDKNNSTGAICVPIYQSSTFAHPSVGKTTGYDYSRLQNPTRESLEILMANLENGYRSFAFSTGMAAISAVMELFSPDDHIIASDDLYGGAIRLFENISKKNGYNIEYAKSGEEIKDKICEKTKAIFIETPTNPMMGVFDLKKIKEIISDKNILLIVDNTFLTPYFQKPLDIGADIVIHSGTKFLGGHNDTLAGFLVCKDSHISEKIEFIYKTIGACLSPFDSFLILRGIKTLPIRMEKAEENAKIVVKWLLEHKKVKKVFYVGLESHEGFEISKKQSTGFGSMISFELDSKESVYKLLSSVETVIFAESLGGVESLITYPITQTHADVLEEKLLERGINDKLVRMSVGIENIDDIILDLSKALGMN